MKREKKSEQQPEQMITVWTKSVYAFCAINICGAMMYWVLIINLVGLRTKSM